MTALPIRDLSSHQALITEVKSLIDQSFFVLPKTESQWHSALEVLIDYVLRNGLYRTNTSPVPFEGRILQELAAALPAHRTLVASYICHCK